ncbi:MAG: sugar ABC transporter permease, partial [Mesorhizobium sp.]
MLFLLPAILLVLVFRIFPLFWGFGISLTSATSTDPGQFIGAGNYLRALDDPNFRSAMANAVVVLLSVPIFVTIPMLLAILIHQGVPGRTFFRSVYFFPAILSSVIIGSIFSVVLSFNGNLNALLGIAGISGVDWLGHSATALPVTLAIQC